ncbi:hypothetical protein CDQ91_10165 [Sphingopyxis witflariensis]|uniref:Uncharacterized protein n=1 Tax=Sphingopyxis witflariensis TaxID=173675 RepID=A0A246JY19_9SPHN|nr:hypothetical protein CDQ91_10165 [Sphingopyxis witflariensis]
MLEDIKGYAFHIPGCAHFRLENGPHGLRHSVCDCGFVETSNAAAALTPSALPECPHEAWEDRGGANCCVDCGIWFEDATPSALSGDAREALDCEGLGDALGVLSHKLRMSGFLATEDGHAAYEKVVAEFQALSSKKGPRHG